jgi:hypothetical protein
MLSLLVLLVGFIPLSVIHTAKAGISDATWIAPTWHGVSDPLVGSVAEGYVAGSPWTLNLNLYNSAWNGSEYLPVTVTTVAVWFDWNKFYNISMNDFINTEASYLLTVTGTTETNLTLASALFTHSYNIYVVAQMTYQVSGAPKTTPITWGPWGGNDFAIISPTQYSASLTKMNYEELNSSVYTRLSDYADTFELLTMAQSSEDVANMYYGTGNFAGALSSYNTAYSLLNQSFVLYTAQEKQYNTLALNRTQADLNLQLAQINAINANASYYTAQGDAAKTLANGQSSALMINSVGFLFFGLGFIVFGLAAVSYTRKPKPPKPAPT